ncbi:MAG TPA: hypothetical protein VMA72_28855 [Streptosporangiaceae bacterium]|nr:hypothetical protein [Streptosporangiaceae bacterium]
MRLYRFRALVTVDPPAANTPDRSYASGTRAFLVHANRIGEPARAKFFQAMMTWDEDTELRPGDRAVVTITVADSDAPAYLDAGQRITLWGGGSGHGMVARQVYTASAPS